MAITVVALASGSKGNSVLVSSNGRRFLIDCGIAPRTLCSDLKSAGCALNDVEGIIITHEHDDHIRSAMQLADNYGIPLIAQERTLNAVKRRTGMRGGSAYKGLESFELAGMEITPFRTSHDAVFPVGYSIADKDSRFVYATDLGYVSPTVMEQTKGADIVMLESNHDVEMLLHGAYPAYLKQRILGSYGHLSNFACANAIKEIALSGTKNFILGHLSENNNTEQLAFDATVSVMKNAGALLNLDYFVCIAEQRQVSSAITSKAR